jgi:hypothetical protein
VYWDSAVGPRSWGNDCYSRRLVRDYTWITQSMTGCVWNVHGQVYGKGSSLARYDTVLLGEWFLAFWIILLHLKYHRLLSQWHVFRSTAVRTLDLANVTCVTRCVISEGHVSKHNMTLDIVAASSRKGVLYYQEASSVALSLRNWLTPDTSETARVYSYYCVFVFKLLVAP